MIYKYNGINNVGSRIKIWSCAYEFENNKITMGLILEPIYGMDRVYEGTMK